MAAACCPASSQTQQQLAPAAPPPGTALTAGQLQTAPPQTCLVTVNYAASLGQAQPGSNGTNDGIPIFFGSLGLLNNAQASDPVPGILY